MYSDITLLCVILCHHCRMIFLLILFVYVCVCVHWCGDYCSSTVGEHVMWSGVYILTVVHH